METRILRNTALHQLKAENGGVCKPVAEHFGSAPFRLAFAA
jgi:hypothetical protein